MHPAPTSPTLRARAKREQILRGAQRVFLREGFAAASTEEIAREAGVSTRTLYAYFPSKVELFGAVLRALTVDDPQMPVLEALRTVEPRSADELRSTLLAQAHKVIAALMSPEYVALLRTMIADSHRFPQLAETMRSTIPERGFQALQALLRRAQANGIPIQGDPDVLPRLFIGPLLTYALLDGLFRPNEKPRLPDAGKIEEIVDLYLRAIIRERERHPGETGGSQRGEG